MIRTPAMHLSLTALVALLAVSVSTPASAQAQCANPTTRSEWRQLSASQQQAYIRAVDRLKARPKGPEGNPAQWNLDQFAQSHMDNTGAAHNNDAFFPWHRRFIDWYERALRSIDPSISQPYWDWTLDSQNPLASSLMTPGAFGGNGRANDNCVADGSFVSKWQMVVEDSDLTLSCLTRCAKPNTILRSAATVTNDITSKTTFADFRRAVEYGSHALVHVFLGGGGSSPCGQIGTMASPNDPLFFLHHTMVDRMWWRWQTKCDGQYQNAYTTTAALNNMMESFGEPVSAAMNTRAGPLCYTYSASRSDGDLSGSCPSKSGTLGGPTGTASRATATATATAAPTSPWFENTVKRLLPKVQVGSAVVVKAAILELAPAAALAGPSPTPVRRPAKRDGAEAAAAAALSAYPNADIVSRPTESAADKVAATATATATMASGAYPTTAALPMPTYVPLANYTVKAPPAEDKKDLVHIRYPSSVGEGWAKRMGYDLYQVRLNEIEAMHVVDRINNTPGYDSPSALKHFAEYNGHKKGKCVPAKNSTQH
ncbi:hypothetical protein BC831DRAFT_514895 [Entophlyctis helioformis]|nr:hypothetical protein BC831DRAFT_514895 [Entophlyctis helioformis]